MRVGLLGPPHGQEPTVDALRNRQLEQARSAGWPELERSDLVFHRFGSVEHRPTGTLYCLHRGQLTDALYVNAVAWFEDASGEIRFLEEPASGPRTVAELKQRRAQRGQRRAQKAVRSWRR